MNAENIFRSGMWEELISPNSSSLLIAVLDAIQEGIIIADNSGEIIYVNPAFLQITSLTRQQRVGKNIFCVSPNGPLSQAIKTGKASYNEKYKMFDVDAEILTHNKPILINGEKVGGVSIFQDVTEVQNLIAKLEGSQKKIKVLSDNLANMTIAKYDFEDIVGESLAIKKSLEMAKIGSKSDSMVLILGESGTGKELFAHAIHQNSQRRNAPFVKVNCAAIPENLMESEFFGYEKGAFTGANKTKQGMFELADQGTIFLDEIGDMDLFLQSKLLRVLEGGEMFRVGGTKTIKVDTRVIAATNKDLKELIKKNLFREDLFYRLDVIDIEIPPLRERNSDVVVLAEVFLKKFNKKMEKSILGFSEIAKETLMAYDWPGNVRELRNSIEKAAVMAEGEYITPKELQINSLNQEKCIDFHKLIPLETMEKEMIKLALEKFGHTVEGKKKAAKELGISMRTLYNKINKYNAL